MSRAICVRCGAARHGWAEVCPGCGHRPEGEGLLIAWLLSEEHLSAGALERAAERIRAGEPVRASAHMLARARKALGREASQDPGMTGPQRRLLVLTSLLLTALPGLALWWHWRQAFPRSASQAVRLSLPAGALAWGASLWVWWTLLAG